MSRSDAEWKFHWQGSWDGKVHGADMGPISGRQDPGRPHAGLMNFPIWGDKYIIGIAGAP